MTPAQIALVWLLAQLTWIAPIPGTTKLRRLEENLGGGEGALTPDHLAQIEQGLATVKVKGDRYPASAKSFANR